MYGSLDDERRLAESLDEADGCFFDALFQLGTLRIMRRELQLRTLIPSQRLLARRRRAATRVQVLDRIALRPFHRLQEVVPSRTPDEPDGRLVERERGRPEQHAAITVVVV